MSKWYRLAGTRRTRLAVSILIQEDDLPEPLESRFVRHLILRDSLRLRLRLPVPMPIPVLGQELTPRLSLSSQWSPLQPGLLQLPSIAWLRSLRPLLEGRS